MIGYIKGQLTYKSPVYVLLECSGIGYQVYISLNTFSAIQELDKCKLLTYQHITETSQALYGFADEAEKMLFILLISVSGIGPGTARVALSSLTPHELKKAILQEDVRTIQGIKGIGPKSAKRMILELKDKLVKGGGEETFSVVAGNSYQEEALSALIALGFGKAQADKAVSKLLNSGENFHGVEDLIKKSLKLL